MNTNDKILYFDLDINSLDGSIKDKIGYIKDESEIASTFNEKSSDAVFTFSKPLVVFDKKDGLLNRVKVIPYTGDLEGVSIDIDISNFNTFIDKVILVSYSMKYWGFIQYRAFVVTDKQQPCSIYRTMLEFSRLMKYIDPDDF